MTKGDDTPAEEATNPSIVSDTGEPIQSTAPEPLSPSPDPLSVAPLPDGQAETSTAEKAHTALLRADETTKLIDGANAWKGAISGIKMVMDTVSPIAEVRTISTFPLLD